MQLKTVLFKDEEFSLNQRCERPQGKTAWNQAKMKKNRLKMKEKAEILALENFQKWGNQLKRGTLTPLLSENKELSK